MASRVQEALEFVGMSNLRIESQLDYLEAKKQRVAIAGIVAMRPSI